MESMAPLQDIIDSDFRKVVFVDPSGRDLVDMGALVQIMPHWVQTRKFDYRCARIAKVTNPYGVGPEVWQTGTWPALGDFDLFNRLFIPVVFSVGETIYVVRTEDPAVLDDDNTLRINVDPMVTVLADGAKLANADLFDVLYHVPNAEYLLRLQAAALRKYPPISFTLLRYAGLDPSTVMFMDGRKLRGTKAGATLFRARPVADLDLIDFDYLLGEDEGRLFLSHLPHRCRHLRQAYTSLRPISQTLAKTCIRQGEWWFVPSPNAVGQHGRPDGQYLRSTNVKAKRFSKSEMFDLRVSNPPELHFHEHGFKGTYGGRLAKLTPTSEHFGKEVVRGEDGRVWVRGWVKHREHDHEPVDLDGWHQAVHNGQVQAWSAQAARRLPRK